MNDTDESIFTAREREFQQAWIDAWAQITKPLTTEADRRLAAEALMVLAVTTFTAFEGRANAAKRLTQVAAQMVTAEGLSITAALLTREDTWERVTKFAHGMAEVSDVGDLTDALLSVGFGALYQMHGAAHCAEVCERRAEEFRSGDYDRKAQTH